MNRLKLSLSMIGLLAALSDIPAMAVPVAPLATEAKRELSQMRTSHYQHITDVDEQSGKFFYDCSGLVDYALKQVALAAYQDVPISSTSSARPLAQDFYQLFSQVPVTGSHWTAIKYPIQLGAGDIVSWLRPPESTSPNTGHVMIVVESARQDPNNAQQILVTVIDSTESAHDQDSRAPGTTGLGTGTIGIMVDSNGLPIAYRWKGLASTKTISTKIALGRLRVP